MYNNQVNQNAFDNANNQNYELRTYYNELTERQNALVLDVPVVIDFRTAIGEKWSFEWGLGAKPCFFPTHRFANDRRRNDRCAVVR